MSKEQRDLYVRAQILENGVHWDNSPRIHLSVWAVDGSGHPCVTDQYIWDANSQTGATDRHYRRLVAELRLNYDKSSFVAEKVHYDLDHAERSETSCWENLERMSKTLKRIERELDDAEQAKRASGSSTSYLQPLEFIEWLVKTVGAKGFIELGRGDEHKIIALSIGFARLDHWMRGILNVQKDGVAA